jgi:hypothetical protein
VTFMALLSADSNRMSAEGFSRRLALLVPVGRRTRVLRPF